MSPFFLQRDRVFSLLLFNVSWRTIWLCLPWTWQCLSIFISIRDKICPFPRFSLVNSVFFPPSDWQGLSSFPLQIDKVSPLSRFKLIHSVLFPASDGQGLSSFPLQIYTFSLLSRFRLTRSFLFSLQTDRVCPLSLFRFIHSLLCLASDWQGLSCSRFRLARSALFLLLACPVCSLTWQYNFYSFFDQHDNICTLSTFSMANLSSLSL